MVLTQKELGGFREPMEEFIGIATAELRRLYDKAHERFVPYLKCSPSKARPWGISDRAVIEEEIARHKKPA